MNVPEQKNPFVEWDHRTFYKIENAQTMKPFFIQVVSPCDIWLFLSSNGGVTAGRRDADGALFPYETDDKLHHSDAGARNIVRARGKLWEPFPAGEALRCNAPKTILKSADGTCIAFQEENRDLRLSYAYGYESSEQYGVVKTVQYKNTGDEFVEIEFLDGVQNILPFGVNAGMQASSSTLVDAYKANELTEERVAVYSLTTYINDTPNPIEMLRANVAWTTADAEICLSAQALQDFALGRPLKTGESCYGCRGAFWVHKTVGLAPGETYTFSIVMDCGYDHARLAKCRQYVAQGDFGGLRQDIEKGRARLREIVRQADGVQESADPIACAHHYLNTLYNVMRGGTFENGYAFDLEDFARFARIRNRPFCGRQAFWERIKECETIQQAREKAAGGRDAMRLMMEYLPLSFSRRHGDPSRPWNRFSIRLKDEDGKKISRYEGNWRDIFQNWEALGLSFPEYYENMVAKFVNASTVDGFNPYRITSEGIDWERPQPDNPFSGIGYWGDHQIIYLLRLLNGLKAHFPDRLDEMLGLEIFSYADVPYRIKPFEQIVENSKDTIVYCADLDRQIEERCARMGTDGRLVLKDGAVYTVTLAEKLMVPMLAKVCNLMKNGGIWMNTQRPEWNDANNAIVGIGLSMVTVYHLYAYQVEGAPAEDGKRPSIWDTFAHTAGKIQHGETGDMACDHYHLFERDVDVMREMGLQAYRFSISWPRVMPDGQDDVNEAGLAFYDRLIDRLLEAGIEPFVTLYHWDLPQKLQDMGGWNNPETARRFCRFAQVVAKRFKGRVKNYMTFNEPQIFIGLGLHRGVHAPG